MTEPVFNLDDRAWVEDMLGKLTDIINTSHGRIEWIDQLTGNKMAAQITGDLVMLLIANKTALISVGKSTFKTALSLLEQDKKFDALVAIYEKMSTEQLLQQYASDTERMGEIVARQQAERKFWVQFATQVVSKVAAGALGALIP